jgi:hypothetical protein
MAGNGSRVVAGAEGQAAVEREKERSMRGDVEQRWANRLKSLRVAVRLKYSLMADEELNRLIDEEKRKFFKNVQLGVMPAPVNVDRALGE